MIESQKRILLVSTVARQFYLFEKVNIAVLRSLGFEIHAAADFRDESSRIGNLNIVPHHVMLRRSPLSPLNVVALMQLLVLVKKERIDAIHCHSPMGGVLGRIVGRLAGIHPVIYTAHGFHFHRGSSRLSWLVYRNIEKWLSRYTDVLCTINDEDYRQASELHAGTVVKVPGVGLSSRQTPKREDVVDARRVMGADDRDLILMSVGELNRNKNHRTVIRALSQLELPTLKYVICGRGRARVQLEKLAHRCKVSEQVVFLGFRDDVEQLLVGADVYLQPSLREGLPVALLEAMGAGLPCIVSSVRGNTDLIKDGFGGLLVQPLDVNGFARAIGRLRSPVTREEMGRRNKRIAEEYTTDVVRGTMMKVYSSSIKGNGATELDALL